MAATACRPRPLPWWSGDKYDWEMPRSVRDRNLRLKTREALSKMIIERASDLDS